MNRGPAFYWCEFGADAARLQSGRHWMQVRNARRHAKQLRAEFAVVRIMRRNEDATITEVEDGR